jgi:acetylornithine deacetylase/succinyl-diaminopimelate desuccinylase-like protein
MELSKYSIRFCRFALFAAVACAQGADPLLDNAGVKKALAYLETHHEAHVRKQVEIAEVPAPTFAEKERAQVLVREFQRVGLKNIEIDPRGNVLGWRDGTSPRTLVVAAHLDTVFPAGTGVKVKRSGARMNGPGLMDDSRGLAVLLALVEALDSGSVATNKSLLFVANVCEEGLGDLLGIKYLLREGRYKDRVDAFISIDGYDDNVIVNRAMASKRYRITVRGPGGHSWGNFGRANPAHALGRIMARIADLDVPDSPKTVYNVGRIGGGTSINSIPFESWMDVDMRSESDAELDKLEARLLQVVRAGVEAENKLRAASGTRVEAESKLLATRYSGTTAESTPLVQAALWAARTMGRTPRLAIGSTDSNVPINMGIPAVTIAGGGRAGNLHSLEEWFEPEGAWKGAQQALLTVLAYDSRTR